MPLYDYKCPEGHVFEQFQKMGEGAGTVICPSCRGIAEKQLSAPMVRGDYPGYSCPITGTWVEGRRAHEENLARHGCRVLEVGEKEQAERVRKSEEQRFENSLDETVERVLSSAGSDAVAVACNEVAAGFTAEVVRN